MIPKPPASRYLVLKDTREQAGWVFVPSKNCLGMRVASLPVGSYTIEGHEDAVVITRIGSVAEFADDIFEPGFDAKLGDMAGHRLPIIVCEFDLDEVMGQPTPYGILKRLADFQIRFPRVHFWFAGRAGKAAVSSLFKRVLEAAA